MKGLRPPAPRVPPGARGPSTPRARSLRSPAGLRARARGHAGRDPRPQGPHPPRRSRSLRSLRTSGSRACPAGLRPSACSPGFLRTPRGRLRRGPRPGAAPLRRGAAAAASRARSAALPPSLRSSGPAPRPSGRPASPSAPFGAAVAASSGLRAPGPLPPHPLRCGLPVRSPLLCSGSAVGRRRAGLPLGPPASRLRGRLAPARAASRAFGPLLCRRWRPGRWVRFPVVRWCRGVLPCAPPAPPPPLGAPGGPRPVGWLRPPLRGPRFSRPSRGPPSRSARARRGISARLTFLKIVNRGSARRRERPFYPARQGQDERTVCCASRCRWCGLDPPGAEISPGGA